MRDHIDTEVRAGDHWAGSLPGGSTPAGKDSEARVPVKTNNQTMRYGKVISHLYQGTSLDRAAHVWEKVCQRHGANLRAAALRIWAVTSWS